MIQLSVPSQAPMSRGGQEGSSKKQVVKRCTPIAFYDLPLGAVSCPPRDSDRSSDSAVDEVNHSISAAKRLVSHIGNSRSWESCGTSSLSWRKDFMSGLKTYKTEDIQLLLDRCLSSCLETKNDVSGHRDTDNTATQTSCTGSPRSERAEASGVLEILPCHVFVSQ